MSCEQEPTRISTAREVVGELPRIEPVPVSSTGSTTMVPDPAPGWTSAGPPGSGTSACGTGPVCRSGVLSAGGGGAWSEGGAPPDGSDPTPFEEGRCGEADGADSGRVVHRDAWHGRGERVNVRQEAGLLLVGRTDLPDRARKKTWWCLMCPSSADAFTRTTSRSRGRCWCRTGSISVPPPRRRDVTARTGAHARGAWARAAVGHHRRTRGHLSGRVPLAGAEPARTRRPATTPPSCWCSPVTPPA